MEFFRQRGTERIYHQETQPPRYPGEKMYIRDKGIRY